MRGYRRKYQDANFFHSLSPWKGKKDTNERNSFVCLSINTYTMCERMCTGMFLFVYLSRIRQVITSEQGKKESELHDKRTNAFSFLSDRFFRFYISFSRISYNKSAVENIRAKRFSSIQRSEIYIVFLRKFSHWPAPTTIYTGFQNKLSYLVEEWGKKTTTPNEDRGERRRRNRSEWKRAEKRAKRKANGVFICWLIAEQTATFDS